MASDSARPGCRLIFPRRGVAQLVAQRSPKPQVAGSSPVAPAAHAAPLGKRVPGSSESPDGEHEQRFGSAISRKKAEVAERRRRGTNPADDRPDVDDIDDELIDELESDEDDIDDDDEFEDSDDDDDDDDASAASNGGRRTATKTRRKS